MLGNPMLWHPTRVYAGMGVVVVGGRGYYCLNFPFSIRLKILAKKYFCPPLDPPL